MKYEFLTAFRDLSLPYWRSEDRWKARALLAAIIVMNLGMVYIQVLVNEWTRVFYNVLENLDKTKFFTEIATFCFLAGAYIAQAVYMLYLSQMLQIRWRKWLTDQYLRDWLSNQAYYRVNLADPQTDNPDQRISEDINSYIEMTISLGASLLNSVATLLSFLAILWQLSGTLVVPLGSIVLHIPGYMLWAALVYSLLGTWLTMRIGNPLILLNFKQQRFEADFRFSMVRVRENSESIALYGGEEQEGIHLRGRFAVLMENFWTIMKRQKRLSWLTNTYGQAAVIFPVLMAAPRFFAGEMQLGGLMQTAGAFAAVHGALSYLVTSYTSIAKWHAVIDRLVSFSRTLDRLRSPQPVQEAARILLPETSIRAESLGAFLPNGKLLFQNLNLDIRPGSRLLITGPSGCGKSTLIRALAGIWPYCRGNISMPESSKVIFLPQRPYLPLGTLRDALCYPHPNTYRAEELESVLHQCGLDYLIESLGKDGDWSHVLSLGEQQRLAFSRVMLARPDFLFLDEATASLDEKSEAALYGLLCSTIPHAAVTSVGHRSSLLPWHTEKLTFDGEATWIQSTIGKGSCLGTRPDSRQS